MLNERLELFEFREDERRFLKRVCEEIESFSPHLSVYAGSSDDVEHGVLIGSRVVFIDSHTPEINVHSIKEKLDRVADSEVKLTELAKSFPAWKFETTLTCEKFVLEYWCADATKVLPDSMGVYFVKVPLPKEMNVGCLCDEKNLKFALSRVVEGGYFLERECPINPEKYGFRLIASGELSGLSIHSAKGNLYKKCKIQDV